ncbi:MAG: glycosyltransferase [Patescibacteria group bacterium]
MEKINLRVLMISSDRNILVTESAVTSRINEYRKIADELHIILLSDKKHNLKPARLFENVWVYPTNSDNRFLRPMDAVRIGKKITCSLITTQDPFECGWVGMRLKKLKKIPLEVQLHTDPFSVHFAGGLFNIIRKWIMKSVLRQADSVRVVLRSVGDELMEKYGVKNISVLPIYIDRTRIEGRLKFDLHDKYRFKTVLLMVTRLAREKNINTALECLKKVRHKFPDTGMVIVGSGTEKFEEQDGVVFVEWQEDLSSFYKTSDIFIQTSDFEGYGLSLVEAGLSGMAVVSTSVGVAKELVEEKDLLISTSDAESFAVAVDSLINNKDLRERLGNSLKKSIEAKVLTKEAYLNKIRENWEKTARK